MEFKDQVIDRIKSKFPEAEFEITEFRDELSLTFDKKFIVDICKFLKEDPSLEFNRLTDVTAIDWAERKNRFTVVYNLYSMPNRFRLRLRCPVDHRDCTIDTVTGVWKAADWYERETYDMYGIEFNNHPDLRRMYMPEDFEYHPLRKDYPVMGHPGDLSLPTKKE